MKKQLAAGEISAFAGVFSGIPPTFAGKSSHCAKKKERKKEKSVGVTFSRRTESDVDCVGQSDGVLFLLSLDDGFHQRVVLPGHLSPSSLGRIRLSF